MDCPKASRPVSAVTESEARGSVRLAGANVPSFNPDRLVLQAAHLVQTFGLTEQHAMVIATLAYEVTQA